MSASTLDKNGTITHPIVRLSPEILSAIFIESHHSFDNSRSRRPRAYGAPLVWMGVCKRWKDIALTSPQLWACLEFSLSPNNNSSLDLLMVGEWLARAKSCPLSLTLEYSGTYHPVINVFKSHCHHWQHIDFLLPGEIYASIDPANGSLAMLRTLKISFHRSWLSPPLQGFEHAPLLCNFTLGSGLVSDRIKVPWSQLTQFSIHLQPRDFDILHYLPNVVELSLRFGGCVWPAVSSISPITFLRLRTLQVKSRGVRDDNDTPFLDYFVLPALCDMTFECDAKSSTSWGPQVLSFVSRSSTIECITLRNAHLTHDELVASIRALPLLQKLLIDEEERSDYVTNDFLHLLRVGPGNPEPLAPKLTFIGIYGFYYQFDDEVFVDMVESRWRLAHPVANLKTVSLRLERTLERKAAARLDKMKEEGLIVHMLYRG